MERRQTEVRIELRRGIVSIPWSSRDALLEQLAHLDSMNDVRDAFDIEDNATPVRLTDPQKLGLRNVITFWANRTGGSYDDLPEGIYDLRNALQGDLQHVGIDESSD